MTRPCLILLFICCSQHHAALQAQTIQLNYRSAPADNPLKGLVPYAGQGEPFPHSMEFWYFPMDQLMTGPDAFDWSLIERQLDAISSRGCQAVIRVYMEYPGKKSAVPEFLLKQGVKVTSYKHDGQMNHTPDYNDPRTRTAMQSFIAAFGAKYDGDARVGFITMGILGHWGEWHTYPKGELFASEEVQAEVMDAFEAAFKTTKVLMRYPAGVDAWKKAPNHKRPFGYHDDSFAWATLETGRKEDDWFFQPAMRLAGQEALTKWKSQPIGGEIRPEVWGCVFDNPSCAPKGQEFEKCVTETHVSWLMDSGMFSLAKTKPTAARKQEAIRQVQRMGYELFVSQAEILGADNQLSVRLDVINKGVAPFYYDWPVEVIVTDGRGDSISRTKTSWKLTRLLPDEKSSWKVDIKLPRAIENPQVGILVNNPMPTGKPLRFANETQAASGLLSIN